MRNQASPPRIEVSVVGLGPVGEDVLAAAQEDPRLIVISCVEPRAEGKEIAQKRGFEGPVLRDVGELPEGDGVAIICTSSRVEEIVPTALGAIDSGYHVLSTCEELIALGLVSPALVERLNDAACAADRTMIGCGVNPGYVMDVLPMALTLATRDIREIRTTRSVDVRNRRARLQQKVGMGITLETFEERRQRAQIGHVGLRESVAFLADALGWTVETSETVEPVRDEDGLHSRGVRHTAVARDGSDRIRIRGLLEMYAGASERDCIEIDGQPPLRVEFPTGVSGDHATASVVLNVAAVVPSLEPGLRSLADVLPLHWATSHVTSKLVTSS